MVSLGKYYYASLRIAADGISSAQAAMFTVTLLELELGQPSDNSLIDFESDFSVELNCSNPESLSLETTSMEALGMCSLRFLN